MGCVLVCVLGLPQALALDTAACALSHTSHQEFMAVTAPVSLEPTVLHPG